MSSQDPRSFAALPWMGLGLTANLDGMAPPDPWALHAQRPGLFDFVEYSAPLAYDASLWNGREGLPVLFHPVHLNLWGPKLESPEALRALDEQARRVGSPWVGNDIGWWHADGEAIPGYLYVAPPLDARGLDEATVHTRHVQAHLSVPLALENPAVIAVRGKTHVLDFMGELSARTGAPLLLDLGHLLSHQLARGLPLESGFDGFPFERVIELHLAGGVVTRHGEGGARGVYVDDHTQAVREELYTLLEAVIPRCTNLRAVTFEGDGHPEPIAARTLQRLRLLVRGRASSSPGQGSMQVDGSSSSPDHAHSADAIDPALSHRVLLESWGREPCADDPLGAEAELDFRLAVLAQTLERTFPLSRLLLAGTRASLLDFARSDAFTACFTDPEPSRTVSRAFVAWGRDALRQRRDAAAEAALALESAGMRARLEEALFAARALRRHLAGRAWATGTLELEALEGLRQVVARTVR